MWLGTQISLHSMHSACLTGFAVSSSTSSNFDGDIEHACGGMQGCSSVLFFEARKKKDLYVWLAKAPEGPSVKFYVTNGVPLMI